MKKYKYINTLIELYLAEKLKFSKLIKLIDHPHKKIKVSSKPN